MILKEKKLYDSISENTDVIPREDSGSALILVNLNMTLQYIISVSDNIEERLSPILKKRDPDMTFPHTDIAGDNPKLSPIFHEMAKVIDSINFNIGVIEETVLSTDI